MTHGLAEPPDSARRSAGDARVSSTVVRGTRHATDPGLKAGVDRRGVDPLARAAIHPDARSDEASDPVAIIAAAIGSLGARNGRRIADERFIRRIADIAGRRLATLAEDAVVTHRRRLGEAASRLRPDDRHALENALLGLRPDPDRLHRTLARALGPSALLAIAGAACDARGPGSSDALRCRQIVLGGDHPLARELALEFDRHGRDRAPGGQIERLVAVAVENALAPDGLPQAAADAVRALLRPAGQDDRRDFAPAEPGQPPSPPTLRCRPAG